MKLVIQVPCFNEEGTIAATLAQLPRRVAGFDSVEWLIVDDGSTDATVATARAHGVDHVVSLGRNGGLARAFRAGLEASLRVGADVIVNTDADNQYEAADIPTLIAPIVEGRADLVVGDRRTDSVPGFSFTKRRLQRLGSWTVSRLSGITVPDATSGFRAFSRAAALRINVVSDFTYTLESVIQAGQKRLAIAHVPVRTNPKTRPSRLFRSSSEYVARSIQTMGSIYLLYRPMTVFAGLAIASGSVGVAIGVRFLYFYVRGNGNGHVQSLLLAVISTVIAAQLAATGLLSHLLGHNRVLIEDILWRVRQLELEQHQKASAPPPDEG